jgi:predicted metal-dependent phosphoesterase TrpH
MIDLHTHSSASDGSFSAEELVREALKKGLQALALTDHDTVAGLPGGAREAARTGLRFIPGIELEIEDPGIGPGGEFHLLGLGLGPLSPGFLGGVEELTRRREQRNREILDRMHEQGIEARWEDILALSGGYSIGRPHFAAYLVQRRIVKDQEQAFVRYLGKGKPLYMPKTGLEFPRAVDMIHESGGLAVLAHPMSLYVAWGHLPDLIARLRDQGLDGLEAWHPAARAGECRRLESLARSLGLRVTAGSDFHGARRPDRRLGFTAGNRPIGDEFLEEVLRAEQEHIVQHIV